MNRIRIGLLGLALCASAPLSAQSLSGPESIEYHPRLDRTLISNNDNGSIVARAADGSLSLFSTSVDQPFGIELLKGTLFVVDAGRVRGFDIDSAVQVMDLALPGASFLNGITSDGDHTLYVSDFSAGQIQPIDVSNLAAPVAGTPINTPSATPNGLVFDAANNRLLIATWGSNADILSLDLANIGAGPQPLIQSSLGNLDGIALDCNGAIIVSAWSGCGGGGGCLRRFDPPFTLGSPAQVVVNGLSSPADIDYTRNRAEFAVPQSGNNTVSFHASTCEAAIFANDFER